MLNTKLRRTSLILLAVVLMLSVFSMTAFAEETVVAGNDILSAPVDADAEVAETEQLTDDATDETVEETEPADDAKADATDDGHDHDHDTETTGEEEEGFGTSDIVSLIILGVVVIAIAVYCIVKREKVGKFFRSLKSEFKKIVWSPRDQVRKNTIVVVVAVVALAIIIALADLVFMKGITALSVLF